MPRTPGRERTRKFVLCKQGVGNQIPRADGTWDVVQKRPIHAAYRQLQVAFGREVGPAMAGTLPALVPMARTEYYRYDEISRKFIHAIRIPACDGSRWRELSCAKRRWAYLPPPNFSGGKFFYEAKPAKPWAVAAPRGTLDMSCLNGHLD